jgi:hypothetical protein
MDQPRRDARIATTAEGWAWVLHGFSLFKPYPAFWLLLLVFYSLLLILVSAIPGVGVALASILIPGLSAGFMIACQAAHKSLPPLPSHLFQPFRQPAMEGRKAQLILGLVYLACLVVLLGVAKLAGDDVIFKLVPQGEVAGNPTLRPLELRVGGLVAMVLYTPVMMAFWFAPALSFWQGMKPGKALFFSFFAVWRNGKAFIAYGMGWLVFLMVIPMVLGMLLGLMLSPGMRGASLAVLILLPYLMVTVCAMMLSFYSTYLGIFGDPAAPPAPPAPAAAPAEENHSDTDSQP